MSAVNFELLEEEAKQQQVKKASTKFKVKARVRPKDPTVTAASTVIPKDAAAPGRHTVSGELVGSTRNDAMRGGTVPAAPDAAVLLESAPNKDDRAVAGRDVLAVRSVGDNEALPGHAPGAISKGSQPVTGAADDTVRAPEGGAGPSAPGPGAPTAVTETPGRATGTSVQPSDNSGKWAAQPSAQIQQQIRQPRTAAAAEGITDQTALEKQPTTGADTAGGRRASGASVGSSDAVLARQDNVDGMPATPAGCTTQTGSLAVLGAAALPEAEMGSKRKRKQNSKGGQSSKRVKAADRTIDVRTMSLREIAITLAAKERQAKAEEARRKVELAARQALDQAENEENGGANGRTEPPGAHPRSAAVGRNDGKTDRQTGFGPQIQVINGQVVVVQDSLVLEAQRADLELFTRVEEEERLVNSHTYMKRGDGSRWTEEHTNQFYNALRSFGTDFTLIARLFPTRGRRGVKAKYRREERINPDRIEATLKHNATNFNHDDFQSLLEGLAKEQQAENEVEGEGDDVNEGSACEGEQEEGKPGAEGEDDMADTPVKLARTKASMLAASKSGKHGKASKGPQGPERTDLAASMQQEAEQDEEFYHY